MSPRVKPRRPAPTRSSYREFRAQQRNPDWLALDVDPQFREYSGVFWKLMTSPPLPTGADLRLHLSEQEQRVLSKATAGAGGNIVPTSFDEQITAVRRARSVISTLAREIVTADGSTLSLGTTTTHGVSTWTAENAAYTASDEVFGQVTLNAFKASSQVLVSEELLADSFPDLEGYLSDELGGRQATLEETALAVGDGSGKPLGMAAASSGYTVATAAVGSTLVFKAADVATAYATLPVAYLPRASWLFAPTAFRSLAGLTDTAGGLVFPTLHAAEPTLYGRPVYVSPDLPTSAANARSAVFGDIEAAYATRRVAGLGIQRQDEIFSNTGQIGYRIFWRVDGRPVDLNAAIILRHSAT